MAPQNNLTAGAPMQHIFATIKAKGYILQPEDAERTENEAHCDADHPCGDADEPLGVCETLVSAFFALCAVGVVGIGVSLG